VVLTNEASLSKRERLPRVRSRKKRQGKAVVDPFLAPTPVGHVLFHDLGHHIHRLIRPEYKEKEGLADKWAGRLSANFIRRRYCYPIRRRYWYAMFVIRPGFQLYGLMRRKQWIQWARGCVIEALARTKAPLPWHRHRCHRQDDNLDRYWRSSQFSSVRLAVSEVRAIESKRTRWRRVWPPIENSW
jgi:hypothetical protein